MSARRGAPVSGPLPHRFARQAPSPVLAPWVECFWSVTGERARPWGSRVLPDGSNDVVVDLSGAPRPFVVGAMRRAEVVRLSGRVDLLGVRFRPGAALPFLDVPLSELTDREVALGELWGRTADTLADEVGSAAPQERVGRLERGLLRMRGRQRDEDALASRAVLLLRRARGGIGVGAVAVALGVGERRLERLFDRCVGLSPKRLARVLRFLHAVRQFGRNTAPGAALALETGYADQSHFIREFRSLAGVTPGEYAAERRVGFVQDVAGPST